MLFARQKVPVHLTMGDAMDITGLTSPKIRRLIEEGLVYAETSDGRRWHRICRDHLCAYATRVLGQPLTLFTALLEETASTGTYLSEGTFQREQATERARARRGSIYRLVRRDQRAPDSPVWEAWFRGDIHRAHRLLGERHDQLQAQAETLARRGVTTRTVWVARVPPTPYQRYLMAALHHSTRAGYLTRVLSAPCLRHLEHAQRVPVPDFTAYEDEGRIYMRTYTELGRGNGGVVVTHPDLCARLCEQIEDYYRAGVDFADFRLTHSRGDR
jgi:hypothetical protein